MKALIDQYTDKEFQHIVEISTSIRDLGKKLGYAAMSGDLAKRIQLRINTLKISIEHFKIKQSSIKRTESNIFIEHSTADQSTLRKWYLKGEYTPYQCSICNQLPIWENKPLTLILDHINGINNDDRLENLRWVCPNCNQQLDTTNGKNIKIHKKKQYCLDCGKEISLKSTRCQSCAAKMQPRKIENRPSREELKDKIRSLPFTTIASQYGVSDNAIRKWCIGYNLPKTKKEIKKYNNEEWLNI